MAFSEKDQIRLALVEQTVKILEEKVDKNTQILENLDEVWGSTKNGVSFLITLSKITASLAALWASIKLAANWPWSS